MLIYTEITPNPDSLKFVLPPEHPALDRGTWELTEPSPTDPPLVQELWAIEGVRGLFFTRAFVTVTRRPEVSWHALIPAVKEVLRRHLVHGPLSNPTAPDAPPTEKGIEAQIHSVLEEYIRPGIAMDGGDVEFLGFSEGVVRLRLRGSCSGCPSSTFTLKAGIEALLTRLIPEVKAVEAE